MLCGWRLLLSCLSQDQLPSAQPLQACDLCEAWMCISEKLRKSAGEPGLLLLSLFLRWIFFFFLSLRWDHSVLKGDSTWGSLSTWSFEFKQKIVTRCTTFWPFFFFLNLDYVAIAIYVAHGRTGLTTFQYACWLSNQNAVNYIFPCWNSVLWLSLKHFWNVR